MNNYILCSVLSLGLAGKTLQLYLKRKRERSQERINEVLFFPDDEFPCDRITKSMLMRPPSQRVCYNPSCRKLHGRDNEPNSSMIRFLSFLANAKRRVDLCIYLFTQKTLADLLLDLHKSNVIVRIITDGDEEMIRNSQVSRLLAAGIEIKTNNCGSGALMHHKFVVIDDRVLLSGSFNWTNKAVVSNYEAVLVTTSEELVKPFTIKFNDLWKTFVHIGAKTKLIR